MDPNEKTNSTASQTDLQARRTCGVIHRGSRPGEARPDARSSHRPAPCGLFDYIELFISCRSGCAFATLRSCMTAYFLLVRGRPGRRRGQRTEFGLQRNITYSVCSKVTLPILSCSKCACRRGTQRKEGVIAQVNALRRENECDLRRSCRARSRTSCCFISETEHRQHRMILLLNHLCFVVVRITIIALWR